MQLLFSPVGFQDRVENFTPFLLDLQMQKLTYVLSKTLCKNLLAFWSAEGYSAIFFQELCPLD